MLNILTIDFEELYHAEYARGKVPPEKQKDRVRQSVNQSLELLNKHKTHATFFIVGEILEKWPEVEEKIREDGHEIAFHGYRHRRLQHIDAATLEEEISAFNSLIKEKCRGFRAPSFSLDNQTLWAVQVLERNSFAYDSSIFSVSTPLYGVPRAPSRPYRLSSGDVAQEDENGELWEFPLLTFGTWRLKLPIAGGFYLRQCPTRIVKTAIRNMNAQNAPAVLYVHTWELDAETPVLELGAYKSYVTYGNIEKTMGKIENLLTNFKFTSVKDYMEKTGLL